MLRIKSFLCVILLLISIITAQLPTKFDLRDVNGKNYISSVKHQKGGTCWTHGSLAAVEGNMAMRGVWKKAGESGEVALAEYHLDWWNGFNKHNNDDIDPKTGDGLEVHQGGDYRVTSAYIARLEGPTRDSDAQSYDTPPERWKSSYKKFYIPHIEWYTVGRNMERLDLVKKKLMEHGPLGTSLLVGFTNNKHQHYQPPTNDADPNHAVAIVGWDDNQETDAPKPGAWLCKNSWGPNNQIDGYFWISYYDKHSGHHDEMGAVSFQGTEVCKYDNVYYHDYHGWRATFDKSKEIFNAFTAKRNEYIAAVNFFTAVDDERYTVKVYGKFSDGKLSKLLSEEKGKYNHRGLHTVTLSTPVKLSKGDKFYLYLQLEKGGHPYDRTSEVPVLLTRDPRLTIVKSTASPKESYYMNDDKWVDFQEYKDPSEWQKTGNFCIKALTTDKNPVPLKETHSTFSGNSKGLHHLSHSKSIQQFHFSLEQRSTIELTLYNAYGQKIKMLKSGSYPQGNHKINWNSVNYGFGTYIAVLKIKTSEQISQLTGKFVLLK